MRTLWLVGGGREAVAGVERARALGCHVVVSDRDPDAPACRAADHAVAASTYDADATLAAARRYAERCRPLDGVLCVATDVPVTVATVAEDLGLPGVSVASARLATDKLAMKERFRRDRVPIPWFAPVASGAELRKLAAGGAPLIVKPADSRGARGVLRLSRGVDPEAAFETARSHSPTGRVLVERFLTGPQVSTESLVMDGVAFTVGFADRNYELLDRHAPHVIENGGQLPSALPEPVQAEIRDLVGRAAASLGIRDGVVKGDIVVHEGRAYVIELAARLSGGYFCTHEIPLSTGVDLLGCAIRQALGERVAPAELAPRRRRPVVQRYWFPRPGRVVAVRGTEPVARRPGIEYLELFVRPGDRVGPVHSHPDRAGVVIASGDTAEAARAAAERAVADVAIDTVVEVEVGPAPRSPGLVAEAS